MLLWRLQFAPQIFQVMGMGVRASLMSSLITNAVNMAATFGAIFTVDRYSFACRAKQSGMTCASSCFHAQLSQPSQVLLMKLAEGLS